MGASKEVVAGLTPIQLDKIGHFIDSMNPVLPRSAGAAFDNAATLPGGRIAVITAPTLIIHSRDDMLQLYHNAEFAASTIPGAELMSYDSGGHLLIIIEKESVKNALGNHIGKYSGGF